MFISALLKVALKRQPTVASSALRIIRFMEKELIQDFIIVISDPTNLLTMI